MELIFENISKSYGEKHALANINLTLTPGIYGLLGPNGAGKSTMLNILTGNILQTEGRILFNGTDIRNLGNEFRRKIGYCPQHQTLYPSFTPQRFLNYIASLHAMTKKAAQKRIDWVIDILALDNVRHKPIYSLSGGMKQRLMIAQALLHDPEILILDEPTAGLDPNQRIAVRNIIGAISLHKIVIISTHVVSDVEYVAKELLMLSGGTLIKNSTPKDLLYELDQQVWEVRVPESELKKLQSLYNISAIGKEDNDVCLRVLAETMPPFPCSPVRPTLEDVYLHYFDASEGLWDTSC